MVSMVSWSQWPQWSQWSCGHRRCRGHLRDPTLFLRPCIDKWCSGIVFREFQCAKQAGQFHSCLKRVQERSSIDRWKCVVWFSSVLSCTTNTTGPRCLLMARTARYSRGSEPNTATCIIYTNLAFPPLSVQCLAQRHMSHVHHRDRRERERWTWTAYDGTGSWRIGFGVSGRTDRYQARRIDLEHQYSLALTLPTNQPRIQPADTDRSSVLIEQHH
jgi:hypothetical protein